MDKKLPSVATGNGDDKLVHMLYEAVVDNSLWPEMVSELIEHINNSAISNTSGNPQLSGLATHFERAFQLSECIVNLQEQNSTLSGVLDSLFVGVMLFDHAGKLIYANAFATQSGLGFQSIEQLHLEAKKLRLQTTESPARLDNEVAKNTIPTLDSAKDMAIIPTQNIKSLKLPKSIATMVLYSPRQSEQTLQHIKQYYYLTQSESLLLTSFYQLRNLKMAAQERQLTYESARTYIKRIYLKTGVNDQASLFGLIDNNPLALLQLDTNNQENDNNVRQVLRLKDGRQMEYFSIGPEKGHVVLHFDALTGVTIDALGNGKMYLPLLSELNLRIVTPCRPGTFKSDYVKFDHLTDWTPDLIELCDYLGANEVTLLSQAFGSCSALAFAASANARINKVIMCAPNYPHYQPDSWRQMDLFFIISNVIGKQAPKLMEVIIPFLMRSVMQNTKKYLNRHIKKSKCPADIDILSSPVLQQRIPIMLGERTAMGTDGLVQENFLNTNGWDFDLSDIKCDVHIIQGKEDNLSAPEASQQLAQHIPNARITMLEEFGQYLLFSEWPWIFESCAEQ